MHFALICPPYPSHIRVFEALGMALVRRGHRATFLLQGGARRFCIEKQVHFASVGGDGPELDRLLRHAARPDGLTGILRTVRDSARETDRFCREGPAILRAIGAQAVLGDQMEPASGLLARALGLPFMSVAAALPVEPDPSVPLPWLGWEYDPTPKGQKRNRGGVRVARLLLHRQRQIISRWAARFGLPPLASLEDCLSPLGTIAQTVAEFDYPRHAPRLYPVGPLRVETTTPAERPFARDAGRPLVFASLGTMQGHRAGIFRAVARACREAGFQLAIAHCGGLDEAEVTSLEVDFVTSFCDQRAMLAMADICVTHAGLNTTLEALEAGVPMLAVPLAFDQPGVAARIVHHGAGLCLSRRGLTAAACRAALERLAHEPSFRLHAAQTGHAIRKAGGVERAADIVEAAMAQRMDMAS